MYRRTNKNRFAVKQVAQRDQQQRNLRSIAARVPDSLPPSFTLKPAGTARPIEAVNEDELAYHHLIAADEKKYIHLPTWLNDPIRRNDPAFHVGSFLNLALPCSHNAEIS
jgi:hypothetical protein